MRKSALPSVLLVAVSSLAWAQRGPGHRWGGAAGEAGDGRGARHHGGAQQGRPPGLHAPPYNNTTNIYGSTHGFGNVVFPGTGHAPGTFSPFSITDPSFGARLTGTVSGFGSGYPYGQGYAPGYRGSYGHSGYSSGAILAPYVYSVPFYVPYPAPAAPPPQVIYIVPGEAGRSLTTTAPATERDSVVTYIVPSRRAPAAPPEAPFFLIAFKSHTIYSVTDHWLEGDTLHYLTTSGAHNQASLDQIDLDFTTRLNRERGVEFRLEKK